MTEAMMYLTALAYQPIANIAATTTFSASSARLEFLSSDLKEAIDILQDDGIRGTRTRNSERIVLGNVHIGGSITLQPSVAELEGLMPYILGTATNAGSYVVADDLPNLYLLMDLVTKVVTWTCAVTKATFSSGPGEKLTLKLDLVGSIATYGAAGTFASASIPAIDNNPPYRMADLGSGITINSIAYLVDQFELSIDNKIVPTFLVGVNATDLKSTDRVVNLHLRTKYTSVEAALQTDQRAGTTRACTLAFTNAASQAMTFTLPSLIAPPESVIVESKEGKLRLTSNYQCYGLGASTKEIVVTLPA